MAFTINGTGVSEWKTLPPWHIDAVKYPICRA
jgi:hypothetical protein